MILLLDLTADVGWRVGSRHSETVCCGVCQIPERPRVSLAVGVWLYIVSTHGYPPDQLMPNQPKTIAHTIRVEDDLWKAARATAYERGETVSDAIRRSLRNYTRAKKATQ